jgi:hypothetical protein
MVMITELIFVLYTSVSWYIFSRWLTLIAQRRPNFEDFICYTFEALFMSIMYPLILITSPEYLYESEIFVVDL